MIELDVYPLDEHIWEQLDVIGETPTGMWLVYKEDGTLETLWSHHRNPVTVLDPRADEADIILCCYPASLPDVSRKKALFPDVNTKVDCRFTEVIDGQEGDTFLVHVHMEVSLPE